MPSKTNPHIHATLSRRLSREVEAENGDCFTNSLKAVLWLDHSGLDYGYLDEDDVPYYVEGFCAATLIVEHGWIEVYRDGVLRFRMDPTPTYCDPKRLTLIGGYFPVVRYTAVEARAKALVPEATLPFNRLWTHDPESREPYDRAHRVIYGMSVAELHAKLDEARAKLAALPDPP